MSAAFARLSRSSSTLSKLALGGAAATTAVYYLNQQSRLRLDAARDANDPVLKTPQLSWVPPTREEMLGALKKNAMLPKKFEPTDQLAQARDVKIPQVGTDDEGYDLLVSVQRESICKASRKP